MELRASQKEQCQAVRASNTHTQSREVERTRSWAKAKSAGSSEQRSSEIALYLSLTVCVQSENAPHDTHDTHIHTTLHKGSVLPDVCAAEVIAYFRQDVERVPDKCKEIRGQSTILCLNGVNRSGLLT